MDFDFGDWFGVDEIGLGAYHVDSTVIDLRTPQGGEQVEFGIEESTHTDVQSYDPDDPAP